MLGEIEFGDQGSFDWGGPGSRPLGCNERQIKFARAILEGSNRTQAAQRAGYGGNDRALRSQGHRTYHSPKVQALLRMARAAEDGEEPEGTSEELRGILWKEARHGANPQSKLRAAELIARYFEGERTREKDRDAGYYGTLGRIADNVRRRLEAMKSLDAAKVVHAVLDEFAVDWSDRRFYEALPTQIRTLPEIKIREAVAGPQNPCLVPIQQYRKAQELGRPDLAPSVEIIFNSVVQTNKAQAQEFAHEVGRLDLLEDSELKT